MNSSYSLQNPDEIYPIPEIPSEIKDAVSNEKLVVFIGAGASRIIGCSGWKDLAEHLVDTSFRRKRINHWEQERLKTNDPRKTISILKTVLEQVDYEKALEESLQAKPDLLEEFPIYNHLIKLRSIYITTNIDTYFDSFFEQPRIYIEPSQFKSENLTRNTLFKLHGSMVAHKTVILTTQDYIIHYNRPEIKTFLKSIFNNDYIVLFVGYSLAELEILDYVLLKGDFEKTQDSKAKEAKHFLVLPFYRSEKGLLRFERSYFDTLKVMTVPYAIDERGHNQLYFVIEAWEKEINISTPYLFKSYKFIEDNVSEYNESNASEILQLIKNDDHFKDHFFKRLMTIKWFEPLKEKGYFSPKNAPAPISSGQKGYYSILQWNVVPYLERVSQQVSIQENEKYIDDLLSIIKEVSNYKDSDGKHIDNYRTWYYFVKILLNLPNDKIPFDIIELISTWLDSKFSTSLPGAEIAGKLLPKFLNSDDLEDWKKAERLIEIITDIKWIPVTESQRNTYERDIEARIIIEPYWLRKCFEKRFERIGIVCSTRVIDTIAKRILTIFSKQYDHAYDVDYEGRKYQIAHSLIEDGVHKILVHSLRIPEDWDGFSQSTIEKTLVTSFDISDFENMAAFVTKVKEGLIKHAFHSLGMELDEAISSIYSMHDYTYVGYSSLSVSPDHIHINDTKKILIYILKEILIVKAQHDRAETSMVLGKFLSREYPYPFFKRLVLFVAGKEWDKYKEYFFKVINMEEVKCFEESDYAKELSILLKDNFSKFNPDEKEIIKKIIEAGPQLLPDENPEKYTAYWKQKWLSLMKDDPMFASLLEEQKKVTGIEMEKFTFGIEFRTLEGPGPSPLSTEEILKLTNVELVIKLKEFRSEKKLEGMTVAGFSVALKDAVMANPSKFTDNLSHFEDVGFIYMYKILDGLKDTWKAKKIIEWGKIFDFVVPYIKKDTFWKDKYIVEPGTWLGGADHGWIISMVAELIQEGTRDDSWAFPEEYFDEAKEIVFTLLQEPEEVEEISDYVSHTLNTTCGKLITTLVYLAWRIACVNKKKGIKNEARWTKEFKDKFDELLDGKVIDAYTSLGRFLPSLSYLDKEWVKGKIEQTISEKETKYWQAFMEGYLSVGSVYDDLYSLMRPHYEYGLSCEFKQHDREYLIQHICTGYLRGRENLDDPNSLFRKIIDAWRPEQIREMIGFFWMQRGIQTESTEENEKMKWKIIEFWRLLYEKYKDKDEVSLTREDKHILSAVSKLTTFLSKIEPESFAWLMVSSPYVHEDFNAPFFIEYVEGLKDKGERSETAKYIGDVYLKMLEKITPDFDQKHIRSIVEFLYDAGATDIANRICNIYGSRGQEFLRDIYKKYSEKQ